MKQIKNFFALRFFLILFLLIYYALCLLTYKNFGISFDERDVYLRGKLFYIKVRGNDKILQKDFVIAQKGNDLPRYNHIYPAFLYTINAKESMETYHLLNLFFASLIFIGIYEVLLFAFKKPKIAILGPLFLFFTPRFLGDIPSNPKDIPFAISYFLSLVMILFTDKKEQGIKILLLGIFFGITQSLRFIGYSIYIVYFIWQIFNRQRRSIFIDIVLIFLIGFLIHIICLPYLGADPFNHFIDIMKMTKNFDWAGQVLLFGNNFSAQKLPFFYLPTWFLITTPIFLLLLFVLGIIKPSKNNKAYQLFFLCLIINLIIFFFSRPVIYDGLRHMVYLLPIIIVISIFGLVSIVEIFKQSKIKYFIFSLIVINIFLVLFNYLILHPYEYTYFNELVGGLKGAYKRFEIDYWGLSNREATLWIKNNLINKNNKPVTVDVCGNSYSIEYYFSSDMKLASSKPEADYVICWDRFDDNKKLKGKIVHSIKRQGIPLVDIYQMTKNERF